MKIAILHLDEEYKVDAPPPTNYLAWHEWAAIQYKAGRRQSRCKFCGLLFFPAEMLLHGCAWRVRK
jgi:hypothetical protein